MSCCKALTLGEGLKRAPMLTGDANFPENLTPAEAAVLEPVRVTGVAGSWLE